MDCAQACREAAQCAKWSVEPKWMEEKQVCQLHSSDGEESPSESSSGWTSSATKECLFCKYST